MPELFADAEPTKRLFLALLTKDISLEDAILDLVDNSINSAILHSGIDLLAKFDALFADESSPDSEVNKIAIEVLTDTFSITDETGGIRLEDARRTVFRFGTRDKKGRR